MAARTTVVLIKDFPYRDIQQEEFSNAYSFVGAPPGDDASWLVLTNDLINLEKPIFPGSTRFVAAYGYDSNIPTDHAVFAHDFTSPGPPPVGTRAPGGNFMAGDQAACVEWKTGNKNSRGKWIYLRKYLHTGVTDPVAPDNLFPAYVTLLNTYATAVQNFHGGLCSREHGYLPASHLVLPYATTRTLRRRGKRPPLRA